MRTCSTTLAMLAVLLMTGMTTAALAGEEFTTVKEVRLIHGDPANPKSKTVVISDKAKIEQLVGTIKLVKKDPCLCDHLDSAVFVQDTGQITVSLCDHCFDVGKNTYRMPPEFYKLFMAYMAEANTKATTQSAAIPFDTHTGYFVSNKFEPQAPASFVVVRDQKAFDEVFGTAMVMGDKSHRLAADAFDTKMVVSAIKRGKAVVEFTVKEVVEDKGVLTIRYTTTSTKQDSAEFSCPLIVSVPKGGHSAVEFVEDGKSVKKIEVKQAASQPAAAFDIRCNKKGDSVAVTTEADRTIFAVTSPSGISGATIERKGDSWPQQVVLQVHLRGLESLSITSGDERLLASVTSHSGYPRTLRFSKDGKEGPALAKNSPYWMDILAMDAKGQPVNGLPGEGGYFEMVVPKALLGEKASTIKIGWIDFYR